MRSVFLVVAVVCTSTGCEIHADVDDVPSHDHHSDYPSDSFDPTGNSGSSSGIVDPDALIEQLVACDEYDFEPTPLMGPLFDPETGALVGELPAGFIVASTAGWPHDNPTAWEQLDGRSEIIIQDVLTRDGYLGGSFGGSEVCGSARTLTIWRDEATLMAFVLGSPHVDAFEVLPTSIQAWETTHWVAVSGDGVPTWAMAKQKLDQARQEG